MARDEVSDDTKAAEEVDAHSGHVVDPNAEPETLTDDEPKVSDSVRQHEQEMNERGAHQEGEGRIA